MSAPKMKLKLNTSGNAPNGQPSAGSPPPASASLKLNLGGGAHSTPSASTPAGILKKVTGKKRQREDDDANGASATKKRVGSTGGTIKLPKGLGKGVAAAATIQSPRTPSSAAVPFFKINTNKKLKPPTRPLGAGYDSEAEDAEEDPAIEENVILRMEPGPDCDYLRNAIHTGTLGKSIPQGGADIYMRFYKNRRAAIVIRERIYAAVLVDLPCIIESMKSWDKRGWWKSADICQMLLVTHRVPSERDAENVQMPAEVDEQTFQYPHGLTPPMRFVRKRRFRKRASHKTIENIEERVEALLQADALARSNVGGSVEASLVDDQDESEQASDAEGDEDAEGEPDQQDDFADQDGQENATEDDDGDADAQAIADAFAEELAKGDEGDAGETIADGNDAAVHLPGQPPSADATVDEAAVPADSAEAESDEDEDDEEEDEGNEEDQEQARLKDQQREEITDLQRDIEVAQNNMAQASNPIIKQRFEKRLAGLREELASKKRSLGEEDDD